MAMISRVCRKGAFLTACSILLLFAGANAQANIKYSDCFNRADTYYEQIYCEIKAKGEGASLPSFIDFKKNNVQMQALLLKRKAEALRIPFKMPVTKQATSARTQKVHTQTATHSSANCQYLERTIQCQDGVFSIVGNKGNSKLNRRVLEDNNKLALERFSGDRRDQALVLDYLTKSYTRYIEKMLEIGLGGSTMSFTKFYYLFQDLSVQGVDFQQRFETMYGYLKLDKRSLGVSEKVDAIQGLSIAQCSRLKADLFTCDNKRNNRVYLK